MRTREVAVFALVVATFSASAQTSAEPQAEPLPELGTGLSTAALIAAGVAAAAALVSRGGGGDSDSPAGAGGGSGSGDGASPRSLSYTSAGDFQTTEYAAQQGLGVVKAGTLYYNGHYSWYMGAAADPAAGTGIGVKIAMGDTGINPREASTGSAIAIDAAGSYDYIANRAGSGADEYGHGTHVAGIMAAPKNGSGMHGLAYNATIVNFRLGDGNGVITASDAQRGDMMLRAANAGAMIINNSWATNIAITSRSAAELQQTIPQLIAGARTYVAAGGVVVFAVGNDYGAQPSLEAGLPYRVAGLQPGWLAVVAIDGSGAIAGYSNRCGVAAAWCLAAPGGSLGSGLYSMQNNGGYAAMYGTSMAAPHAAAALAALKSMFPNLSYQQIRDRLLYTANRSGTYSDAAAYGQGLMDLATASAPVGGVVVPTGTSATGATAPVEGSGIEFQAGALSALGMQGRVLVVDNYQRAPFWVPAQTFFREATPRLIERQWASLRMNPRIEAPSNGRLRFSHSEGLNSVVSAELPAYRFGFSTGAGGEAILGSHLALASIPHLAAPGVESVALGYAAELGGMRFGLLGTVPGSSPAIQPTLDSSSLGSRRALGAVMQRSAFGTTYGVSAAFADGFERPIGIGTAGAFGVASGAAASSGAFVEHALGRATVLKASFEVAHHQPEASGALTAPDYSLRSAAFGARRALGARTMLSASLKREWSADAAQLHVPLTIDESGNIGAVTYTLPYQDLVGRTSLGLRLDQALTRQVSLRAGVTRERTGFGTTITGIAAVVEIVH
jgi:subtilisin family serine protease